MTIQQPRFPQELVDEILDYCAGDRPSLKTCSLVSREWVSRCRSHLFKKCSLNHHPSPFKSRLIHFCDLLRSPYCTLLPHVCGIYHLIHFDRQDYDCFDEIAADLGRLTKLRELRMTFMTSYHPAKLDFFLHTAFPKITRLHLDLCAMPGPLVNMICLFPALQELEIGTSGDIPPAHPIPKPPPELRSLTLSEGSMGQILAWLDAVGHLPNVRSLTLSPVRRSDMLVVTTALQHLGDALHHLSINTAYDVAEDYVNAIDIFDLSLHRNLETLHIHSDSLCYSGEKEMIPLITKLVAPTLERLSVALDLGLSMYQRLDWAALDTFLSPDQFPRLRAVTFQCSQHFDHDNPNDVDFHKHKFLGDALPLLTASGVLQTRWW
ncbi:hypothetical protein DFH08DRAFT_400333 [Mycena albidolilacea]|uniref:F-box domain-containing protein n=1 Tax=Mycena albidolilacea TaxID=1033008 RepID=A0AAD7EEV3_9AGAR|nr:hypothetical protein DFH08DRAFT_400333 [Mycena albidolilacea]